MSGGEPTASDGSAPRTPEQLARGWHDALVRRDADCFAALFSPDGVMVDVEHRTADLRHARPISGRAAIRALAVDWLRATPQFGFDLLGVLSDSQARAAFRWRYSVLGRDDGLDLEGITWLDCREGDIRSALVCFDSFALLEGLGLARAI